MKKPKSVDPAAEAAAYRRGLEDGWKDLRVVWEELNALKREIDSASNRLVRILDQAITMPFDEKRRRQLERLGPVTIGGKFRNAPSDWNPSGKV